MYYINDTPNTMHDSVTKSLYIAVQGATLTLSPSDKEPLFTA